MATSKHNPICYFAKTNFRNQKDPLGILLKDCLYYFYILGRTGTGEKTLLQTKISQNIKAKRGVCLIDVHGGLVSKVMQDIPKERLIDVVYLVATNPNLELGYNPLKKVSYEKRSLVTSNILEVFQRLWEYTRFWGKDVTYLKTCTFCTTRRTPSLFYRYYKNPKR